MPKRIIKQEVANTLSDNLFILRKRKRVTLREMAKNVSVTYQALSYYERGLRTPSLFVAAELAKYFGVTLEDLFDDQLCFRVRTTKRFERSL